MTRRYERIFAGSFVVCTLSLSQAAGLAKRGAQTPASAQAPASVSTLKVGGDVRMPLTLTVDELKAMPRRRVDVKDEDGRAVTYEGVLVGDVLKRAGATLGPDLRGNAVATYVLASATDGYQVV